MTRFLFQYQAKTEPVNSSPEQVTESRWHQPFSQPVRRVGLATAIVVASGLFYAPFTPAAQAETVTLDKWHRPFVEPVRVKTQPHAPSVVFAFAEGITVDRWQVALSAPATPRRIAPHQSFAFVKATPFAEAVSVDRWQQPLSEPRWSRRPVAQQQAFAFWPYPLPNVDAPVGYYAIYPDRALKKYLPTAQQQSFAFVKAAPFAEAPQLDKWFAPLSEPSVKGKRSVATGQQQTLAFVKAALFAESVSVDRWLQPLATPRWSPRPVAQQQSVAFWPRPIPNIDAPVGYYAIYPDRTVKKYLPTAHQQAFAFVKVAPFAETVSVDRWLRSLAKPRRSRVAGPPWRSSEFSPSPILAVSADHWLQALSQPVRRVSQRHSATILAPLVPPGLEWFAPLNQPRLQAPQAGQGALGYYSGPLVTAPPEDVTLDKWFASLSQPTLRQHMRALYESASIAAVRFTPDALASLVCAAIDIYAAVDGAPDLGTAVAGVPDLGPAVAGAPDMGAVVVGVPDMNSAVDGAPDLGPAVEGTPDLRKC